MYTQIHNYSTNEYDIDNTNKNYSSMGANTSTLRTEEITEMQALSHCMFSSSPHFTPSHPTSLLLLLSVQLYTSQSILSLFVIPLLTWINAWSVSPKEIKRLYKRFKRLDKDEKGSISTDEFLTIPEMSMNPLVSRILSLFHVLYSSYSFLILVWFLFDCWKISMFDNRKDGQVNFRQFVETMSVFHPKGNRNEKLNCMSLSFPQSSRHI